MSSNAAPNRAAGAARKTATKIVIWQFFITLILTVVFFVVSGNQAAKAAFCGGLVAVVPSYYFVRVAFAKMFSVSPEWMFRAFFMAEGVKFLLTTVLFIVVLVGLKVQWVPALITYITTLLAYKAALIKEFKVIRNG